MTTPALTDVLYLWWLGEPLSPQLVGVLRWVRRAQHQHAGLALQDLQTVAQHVDRAFLRNQRQPFL